MACIGVQCSKNSATVCSFPCFHLLRNSLLLLAREICSFWFIIWIQALQVSFQTNFKVTSELTYNIYFFAKVFTTQFLWGPSTGLEILWDHTVQRDSLLTEYCFLVQKKYFYVQNKYSKWCMVIFVVVVLWSTESLTAYNFKYWPQVFGKSPVWSVYHANTYRGHTKGDIYTPFIYSVVHVQVKTDIHYNNNL